MPQLILLLTFLVSAVLTALVIPKIIQISYRKKLFDYFDERKVHKGIVPRLGGVAFTPVITITLALVLGLLTWVKPVGFNVSFSVYGVHMALGLSALLVLYMEGIADDLIGVGYKAKFLVQIICAAMITCTGIWLNDLHGLLGVHELSPWVGIPLTVMLIVFIIDAINLIDGIDGLASGLSMIALFFLGCLFGYCGEWAYAVFAFAALGTLASFFVYNVFGSVEAGHKIFMGDSGSQTIGLVLGLLAVRFCMHDNIGIDDMPYNPLLVASSLLMVPCFDVIRVMIGRIQHHRNPFMPDKTHIHHKFLALGMSHRKAMVSILLVSLFFIIFNLSLVRVVNVNVIVVLDVALWSLMHVWLSYVIRKRKGHGNERLLDDRDDDEARQDEGSLFA